MLVCDISPARGKQMVTLWSRFMFLNWSIVALKLVHLPQLGPIDPHPTPPGSAQDRAR